MFPTSFFAPTYYPVWFFPGTVPQTPALALFAGTDPTTRGDWRTSYGTGGFNLAQDPSAGNPTVPSSATLGLVGVHAHTWSASTTDPRALQQVSGSSRIAACWFSATSFSVDLGL